MAYTTIYRCLAPLTQQDKVSARVWQEDKTTSASPPHFVSRASPDVMRYEGKFKRIKKYFFREKILQAASLPRPPNHSQNLGQTDSSFQCSQVFAL